MNVNLQYWLTFTLHCGNHRDVNDRMQIKRHKSAEKLQNLLQKIVAILKRVYPKTMLYLM